MREFFIFIILLSSIFCKAQKDSVRYELYVRCCMGEVKHNVIDYNFSVFKDSDFICYLSNNIISLPDTGFYTFKNNENMYRKHFEEFKLYRDTFDIFTNITNGDLIWNSKKRKYEFNDIWRCDGCIMDGYFKETYKSGKVEWEGLYKEGVRIWFKSYDENCNLIYYTKRNFWGKEKVILDKRFNSRRGKRKDEDVE